MSGASTRRWSDNTHAVKLSPKGQWPHEVFQQRIFLCVCAWMWWRWWAHYEPVLPFLFWGAFTIIISIPKKSWEETNVQPSPPPPKKKHILVVFFSLQDIYVICHESLFEQKVHCRETNLFSRKPIAGIDQECYRPSGHWPGLFGWGVVYQRQNGRTVSVEIFACFEGNWYIWRVYWSRCTCQAMLEYLPFYGYLTWRYGWKIRWGEKRK